MILWIILMGLEPKYVETNSFTLSRTVKVASCVYNELPSQLQPHVVLFTSNKYISWDRFTVRHLRGKCINVWFPGGTNTDEHLEANVILLYIAAIAV